MNDAKADVPMKVARHGTYYRVEVDPSDFNRMHRVFEADQDCDQMLGAKMDSIPGIRCTEYGPGPSPELIELKVGLIYYWVDDAHDNPQTHAQAKETIREHLLWVRNYDIL